MTLNELKAFIEGMDIKTHPTTEQWARIAGKLALIEPEVQKETIKIIEKEIEKEKSVPHNPWAPQPTWIGPGKWPSDKTEPLFPPYEITCTDGFGNKFPDPTNTTWIANGQSISSLPNNDGVNYERTQ